MTETASLPLPGPRRPGLLPRLTIPRPRTEADALEHTLERVAFAPAPPAAPQTTAQATPQAVPLPWPSLYTWRFKLLVLLLVAVPTIALFAAQQLLWGEAATPTGWRATVSDLSWLWVLPLGLGALSVTGMLMQRKPPTHVPAVTNLVCFRYVSRGTNVESLRAAIHSVRTTMERFPLFPYVIEAVVETPVGFADCPDVTEIVTPGSYVTPNQTLYKARGLQWAVETSSLPDDAWIFHCDEESHVTESLVLGIAQAVAEEEASGEHRIGQGCVLYHHTLSDHPFLTLADSIRTGDDVGRWHLQNRGLGIPLLGMHGSFILVRNNIEKAVGFDHGPNSSVTEDAWWALMTAQAGHRTRWVDGFMVEQAPEKVSDFVKQRRRWMTGLARVARHAPVRLPFRLPLAACMVMWALGPLALIYTYTDLALGLRAPLAVQTMGNLAFACFVAIYVVGLRMTLRAAPQTAARTVALYAGQVLLLPVFALLEVTGTAYALAKPKIDFHVIQKRH